MKVLYDHQIFEHQNFGGISRYFSELIKEFKIGQDVSPTLSLKHSNNVHLKESLPDVSVEPLRNYSHFLPKLNFKGKTCLFNFYNKTLGRNHSLVNLSNSQGMIDEENYDIFHPTFYDDYYLNQELKKPLVITVYDMIHEIFPEYFNLEINNKNISNKRRLIAKADHILAISENTKRDIIKLYGIDEKKISVTHLASSFARSKSSISPLKVELPERYILFTGQRSIYKNFYFFFSSIVDILKREKDLKLVCTGPGFSPLELELFKDKGVKEKVVHFFANDHELGFLYQNAQAFIFPSLYEGFGIPVLEAFGSGCPALLSNSSSLPEIGGNAALYFDPKDFSSIKYTVEKVLGSSNLREELMEKGYKQLCNFSWKNTAEKTKVAYKITISDER